MKPRARAIASLLLAGALAACGGSIPGSTPSTTSAALAAREPALTPAKKRVRVSVRVTIRGRAPHRGNRAHFISPSTDGVLALVYAHDDPHHMHLLGRSATDVSSGSPACGGQTGFPRSCSISVPAPAGLDDFVFTTFDAPPSGGRFSGAHALGRGAVGQRIRANAANGLAIYIGGVIASIGGAPAYASLPADGAAHAFGFVLAPEDFNDNPIVAGENDPYANPITLTLVEAGGSGHASLSLNGAAGVSSIQSRFSSDSLVMTYDGGGSPGYGVTVTISAKGVAAQTVRISPLFVGSTSPFFAASKLGFYASGQQATLAVTELDAPSTTAYSAVANACAGIATVGTPSGSGASASVVASSGTTASASGCALAISDGSSTVTVPVTNTTTGGGVTVPTVTISEFPIPTAGAKTGQLAVGSDGALWFTECNLAAGKIGRIPTSATPGSSAQISEYPIPTSGAGPFAIVSAPDGALWFTERGDSSIGTIPTNATPSSGAQIVEYPVTTPFSRPSALIVGSTGDLWFTDQLAGDAGVMNLGGGLMQTIALAQSGTAMAIDSSGNVWIGTSTGNQLFSVTPSGSVTTIALPASSQINSMVFDAAGNLWMANPGNNAIDELPAGTTTVVPFAIPLGGRAVGVVVGPDGAIWFTNNTGNAIGRMTTAGVFAPLAGYPIPTAQSVPIQLVNGPDGALWFAEFQGNKIGRVVPSGTTPSTRRR